MKQGEIYRISGPVVIVSGLDTKMYDVVKVGKEGLMGEVIGIEGNKSIIQVYEDTSGIKPGEPVENTGMPLSVELGPGLLESIYDGIQRPLPVLKEKMGDFIRRGVFAEGLSRQKKWDFIPTVKKGDKLKPGDIIGTVQETENIEHRIMVPPDVSGTIDEIKEGSFRVDEVVCTLCDGKELMLMHKWAVRIPRPVNKKLMPDTPLITGQRILDGLFPVAKGGTAAIPGPFGSGKCISGDTKILVDNSLMCIKELFCNVEKNNLGEVIEENRDEKLIKLFKPLKIQTFDGKKIVEGEATHVYRGYSSRMIEIKTLSGRYIKLTPMHKLFKLDSELRITETEAMYLKEGDYIISPRKIDIAGGYQKITFETGSDVLFLYEELAELLGYLVSSKSKETIVFNKKKEIQDRVNFLINNIFNKDVNKLTSLVEKVEDILKALLTSPESVIKHFLAAYISCDKEDVEIITQSKSLHEGFAYLLLRLGILYNIKEKIVNGERYYCLLISKEEVEKIHPYHNSTTTRISKQMLYNIALKVNEAFIFYDEITSVKVVDSEEVYDITVPGTHNFVGGNAPMILHNTVTQQQLAKWSDTEIVVYIGCGERGNEMSDVLSEFPELEDPKTGRPLMERTVLIANTSNMPVAAREASVYTGITIAEYYRDMGYDVSLMADSTSRWAEAMREISSRLEEMPGEEGYPAYLAAKLSEFYERAGKVKTLCGKEGSITVIGAVSPPGGDFSEPVTQNTLRIVKVFWALDAKLAQRRHFPAINWLNSYSLYTKTLEGWYNENISPEWMKIRGEAMELLQKEAELQEIVQLVGSDALPEDQQLILEIARMVREYFLQQNAYHEVDTYCPMDKQYKLLKAIMLWGDKAQTALENNIPVEEILKLKSKDELAKVKFEKDFDKALKEITNSMEEEFDHLRRA